MQGQVQGREGLVGWGMGNGRNPQGAFQRGQCKWLGFG